MSIFADLLSKNRNNARNWVEDFTHENGNYLLRCHSCAESFLGHKRRFTCKLCHDNPPDEAAKNIAKEKIKKSFTEAFEAMKNSPVLKNMTERELLADCFNPNETDEQYFLRRKKELDKSQNKQ